VVRALKDKEVRGLLYTFVCLGINGVNFSEIYIEVHIHVAIIIIIVKLATLVHSHLRHYCN